MKAESTIRREISRLKLMAENSQHTSAGRDIAYEAYHALLWVIEDVGFTPRQEIGRYQQLATEQKGGN